MKFPNLPYYFVDCEYTELYYKYYVDFSVGEGGELDHGACFPCIE